MPRRIKDGIWAAMMMPMHEDASLDFGAAERLLQWYAEQKADGVFGLCYSSEIFKMNAKERLETARFLLENVPKQLDMVISAHVEDDLDDQIREIGQLAELGADNIVLIANRLAKQDEDDDILCENAERILNTFPSLSFGLYECPAPYRRLLPPETVRRLAKTNRFNFMKETSCDPQAVRAKIQAVQGTPLKIFNANAATLFETMKDGAAGFCGIMCNFHTDLYARLYRAFLEHDWDFAQQLQNRLGLFSCFERMNYPCNAKLYQRNNLGMSGVSRMKNISDMRVSFFYELDDLRLAEAETRAWIAKHDESMPC